MNFFFFYSVNNLLFNFPLILGITFLLRGTFFWQECKIRHYERGILIIKIKDMLHSELN